MKKVLVITYYWPPAGGGGVQRIAKFCKYLSLWGWEPVVLTVDRGNYAVRDESLLSEVEKIDRIYRAPSLEPHALFGSLTGSFGRRGGGKPRTPTASPSTFTGRVGEYIRLNLFIPDSRIGWRRKAVERAAEIIEREGPRAILSTAPPYTAHLIALELKGRSGLPWIADFRDPWLENHAYNTVPRLGVVKAVTRRLEMSVLEAADRVVCANPGIAALAAAKLPPAAASKFTVITNGYDESDVRPVVGKLSRFTVGYFGTVYPRGFPMELFEVFRELIGENEGFAADFLFRVRGTVSPGVVARFADFIGEGHLEVGPYIPHEEMLDMLYQEQVLVVVINDFPNNFATVPGKIYEYLPTGNPVLGIGPEGGDAAALLSEAGAGGMFGHGDRQGLKRFIQEKYRSWKRGNLTAGAKDVGRYERKRLAGELAGELNALSPPPRG